MKKKFDESDEIESSSAPLIEHLTELRSRLIWCLLAFVVCMIAVFPFSNYVFNFLANPIVELLAMQERPAELIFTGMQQGFMVNVKISLFGGFILAFPFIALQLWKFVAPGLYKQEKMTFLPFLVASPILFFIGSAFVIDEAAKAAIATGGVIAEATAK